MINKKFSKWTVVSYYPERKPGKHYECHCQCGNIRIIPGVTLRAGRSTRCRDCMYAKLNKPLDMIGVVFGKWTVLKWSDNAINKYGNRGAHLYDCICECGTKKVIPGVELRRKRTTQCINCSRIMSLKKAIEKCTRHGMHKTSIYQIWQAMVYRCTNSNATHYYRYGGRGITVCDSWRDFVNFYRDMGDRPKKLTLDRIDNNGNYEPGNCRWVTHAVNCQNRYY